MDSLARNALRLSLAGAGVAVLGAGFVGQASAAETPEAPSAPEASGTSLITDNLPSSQDNDVNMDAGNAEQPTESTDSSSTSSQPDALPALQDLPVMQVPNAMFLQSPNVS